MVVDIPQVNFTLPAGTGSAGRGLIKAFRYGLVMPGGSRIVFDLTGPAKVANSYVLDAANGQPPRLVLEFEEVDRTTFVQSLAAANPSRTAARNRRCRGRRSRHQPYLPNRLPSRPRWPIRVR